eukprot:TRINITY_DN19540_c0_g1_i1.p1 TRINITY_DN19540_c0_g1~~TRINITY_DN19540_c0_g1_i1.p1  ORF type:complete len:553 (+),score=182.26 TRINITY_DN19540_c0_g1_i1:64-1722(+)
MSSEDGHDAAAPLFSMQSVGESEVTLGSTLYDDGSDEDGPAAGADALPAFRFSWRTFWGFTGPGFLMSIAYLDPGNIEADLQAGSKAGDTLLWVLFWATMMGLVLQTMSTKLGVATGKHLAEHCRAEFPPVVRYTLWAMAEIAIICVDCQEVIGTAVAVQILSNGAVPLWAGVLLTALYTLMFLLMDRCMRRLEMLFAVLITVMSLSFGAQYVSDLPDQGEVLSGTFVPYVHSSDVTTAVGLIGAVIMPHNLYLHSGLVLSRDVDRRSPRAVRDAIIYNRYDSTIALVVSFIINLFVVCVFAHCRHHDASDDALGLQTAGTRLMECNAGRTFFKHLFAVGLLASGQAATITSTYAGQYVMQGFLDLKMSPWQRAALSRCVAIVPGLIVGLTAASESDAMQQWLNVVQSVQLPFAIVPLLYFTSSPKVMARWANHRPAVAAGWAITFVVFAANVYLVAALVGEGMAGQGAAGSLPVLVPLLTVVCGVYILLVGWLVLGALGVIRFSGSGGEEGTPRERAPLVQTPEELANLPVGDVPDLVIGTDILDDLDAVE